MRLPFSKCLIVVLMVASSLQGFADEIDEDEAGLLLRVAKQEQLIRTSNFRIDDPELEGALNEMACQLLPDRCDFLRVYALNLPGFNAFVLPNGAIFIQSGLMLRVKSESELAAVLAHEIVHFQEKHTLEAVRRASSTGAAWAFMGAILGAAGNVATAGASSVGQMSQVANATQTAALMLQSMQLIAGLALLEFSRENEEESDMQGAALAASAGYEKAAGMDLWLAYVNEDKAGGSDAALSLLSTHPLPQQRVEYLSEFKEFDREVEASPKTNVISIFERFRDDWVLTEQRILHPDQFAHLVDRQIKDWAFDEQSASHLKAEAWVRYADRQGLSRREKEKALTSAMEQFEFGENLESGLSSAGYRDWGMLAVDLDEPEVAKYALNKYLELEPQAWDAGFIAKKVGSL